MEASSDEDDEVAVEIMSEIQVLLSTLCETDFHRKVHKKLHKIAVFGGTVMFQRVKYEVEEQNLRGSQFLYDMYESMILIFLQHVKFPLFPLNRAILSDILYFSKYW